MVSVIFWKASENMGFDLRRSVLQNELAGPGAHQFDRLLAGLTD